MGAKKNRTNKMPRCFNCGSYLLYESDSELGCLDCGVEVTGSNEHALWCNFWRLGRTLEAKKQLTLISREGT
jgi:hypothetical protein